MGDLQESHIAGGINKIEATPQLKEAEDVNVSFTEEELNAIAREIFSPEDSYSIRALKYRTGQTELEDYQKFLLSPSHALEGLVTFGVGCITGETYKNFAVLFDTIKDSKKRAFLADMMSRGWDNCTATEKSAFVSQVICMMLATPSAIAKLKTLIPAYKLEILAKMAEQGTGIARALQVLGTAKDVLEKVGTAIVASPLDDIAFAAGGVAAQIGTSGGTVSKADINEGKILNKKLINGDQSSEKNDK